ncbi:hypothetical protein CIHG_10415 [Coccidioides immitis H538.4]|uniref:Uncharacterized protein n=1 Tax=Coccidioides immitis H538.4 TaxID=396776 RepID=A0A0J8S656_COCIT|nr:hypothetical protein CIHG_10415 [Coccidioides immitis H538.4]
MGYDFDGRGADETDDGSREERVGVTEDWNGSEYGVGSCLRVKTRESRISTRSSSPSSAGVGPWVSIVLSSGLDQLPLGLQMTWTYCRQDKSKWGPALAAAEKM